LTEHEYTAAVPSRTVVDRGRTDSLNTTAEGGKVQTELMTTCSQEFDVVYA